jgi:signal peptidase I
LAFYICYILALGGINEVLFSDPFRTIRAYKIASGAMKPTLEGGDRILVDFLYDRERVKRGDILVFRFPQDESRDFIERVIGLPGERVEVRGRTVYINGSPLEEPYARYDDFGPQGQFEGRERFGPVRVPEGHLFMMGDNRDNSLDSRAWGFLNMDKVRGEAIVIYWSWDGGNTSVRWSRLGKLLF